MEDLAKCLDTAVRARAIILAYIYKVGKSRVFNTGILGTLAATVAAKTHYQSLSHAPKEI